MRNGRPSWTDLTPGAPVYAPGGVRVGEVTHVTPEQVILDLGYSRPTILKGGCIESNVVRLGARLYFTAPR